MTEQEKAVELYTKYEQLGRDFTRGVSMHEFAKQCALIAVDEIINSHLLSEKIFDIHPVDYWQEVLIEINKL